jgi:hypothetical protein
MLSLKNVREPEEEVNQGGVSLQTVRGRMRMRAPKLVFRSIRVVLEKM